MTGANVTPMSDVLSDPRSMIDGPGADLIQQVGIEADRLTGTMKDGMEIAQTASKDYCNLVTNAYVRALDRAIQNSIDFNDHALTLLQARTPVDALRSNLDFMQKQVSSMQDRFFEMLDVSASQVDNGKQPERRT